VLAPLHRAVIVGVFAGLAAEDAGRRFLTGTAGAGGGVELEHEPPIDWCVGVQQRLRRALRQHGADTPQRERNRIQPSRHRARELFHGLSPPGSRLATRFSRAA
jgi:hypothetical protein